MHLSMSTFKLLIVTGGGELRISPHGGNTLTLGFPLRDFNLTKLCFVVAECLGKNCKEVLCMLWSDAYNRFCPRLVYPWNLVKKYKGKLIFFVGDLDHIAIDRIKVLGNIDSNLMLGHMVYINRFQINAF